MTPMDCDPAKLFGMMPDKEQMSAITAPQGVNIVLAGPGSGKSTVIICRVLYLAKVKKVNTRDITILVFNRDAKESLSRRMKSACDRLNLFMPEICTIHSKCYHLVREQMAMSPDIVERSPEWYMKVLGKYVEGKDLKRGDYVRLHETLSRIRENGLDPSTIQAPGFGDLTGLMDALGAVSQKDGAMSFEEMSSAALNILERSPSARIGHLLVDEAQDITEMQFRIIRAMAGEDLFMVGDGDQCIYGFRHASSRYIESPDKYFSRFTKYYIGTNYRSTCQIVSLSTAFINRLSPGVDRPHLRAKADRKGPVPVVRKVSRQRDQFRFVRDIAGECAGMGKSCCVIYRNNSTGVALANYLLSNRIRPAHIGGDCDFFRSPAVSQILSQVRRQVVGRGKGETPHPEQLVRHVAITSGIIPETTKWAVQERMPKTNYVHDYTLLLEIAESCATGEEFLERTEQITKLLSDKTPQDNTLCIATAHSVKGLEFHTVVLVDMVEGVFPGEQPGCDKRDNREEEARLMYVAMTRATDRLVIMWPERIRGRVCKESQFVHILNEMQRKKEKGGQ